MLIIIWSQSFSFAARRASNGANTLSDGETYESTLAELLEWLLTASRMAKIDSTGEDIIVSHYNGAGIETQRTTITCNPSDRRELLASLSPVAISA